MKVTDSLRLKESIIIESILNKFKLHRYTKKCRVEESAASSPSPVPENIDHIENIEEEEAEINRLLAFEIKVTQGDNGIDIILTHKEKLILIQCKNVETPINVHIVRVFESALSRFSSDSLRLIVYNSKKLEENFATSKAKDWAFTSKKNIKICNEKEFVEIIKNFFENDNDDHIKLINYTADSFDLIKLVGKNVSTTKKTKIIVFTGTIGVGKTTCAKLFESFLKRKGFTFLWKVDYIILNCTQKDMKMFNKFFQNPSEKEYIDRKVDEIEPLDFYKVVFVTIPIKMSFERQQKRARLDELVKREYLEMLNAYYLEDIDLVYPENLKFENIVNLCGGDDCAQCLGVKIYENFFNTLL
ncbi:36692_t:CDS:2 [Racocetra persica]|uniref:36692_t:CDS:1 n=1 Tax=Racocetra persica TaxID=160502 RepID=A0ACA9LYR2_9GLOM|nr:36692_t:CDS:2 [Racocetra persica]